jgi:hypothetical protein
MEYGKPGVPPILSGSLYREAEWQGVGVETMMLANSAS